jgi:hypothetical protein
MPVFYHETVQLNPSPAPGRSIIRSRQGVWRAAMNSIWGDVPTWIGVIAGAITLIVGVREYLIAQRWKRSEFLAAAVDRFFANPGIQTALLLIDYSRIALEPDGRRRTVRTLSAETRMTA